MFGIFRMKTLHFNTIFSDFLKKLLNKSFIDKVSLKNVLGDDTTLCQDTFTNSVGTAGCLPMKSYFLLTKLKIDDKVIGYFSKCCQM